MLKLLTETAEKDFSKYDCFVFVILSHGSKDGIYGTDDEVINIEAINSLFWATLPWRENQRFSCFKLVEEINEIEYQWRVIVTQLYFQIQVYQLMQIFSSVLLPHQVIRATDSLFLVHGS